MKVGYARVSTDDQNSDLQLDALKRAGCRRIYTDKGQGGAKRSRPQLDKCLSDLKPGDALTVWKLDRLGRSLSHLVALLEGKEGVSSLLSTNDAFSTFPHSLPRFPSGSPKWRQKRGVGVKEKRARLAFR
jgi:hypothetical protein